ncbi:hypothetical protein HDU83_002666 [Entophlyctis luteolus]|nr:hypothetical protein HDU83_002666 [Entophlyctis luteolus]
MKISCSRVFLALCVASRNTRSLPLKPEWKVRDLAPLQLSEFDASIQDIANAIQSPPDATVLKFKDDDPVSASEKDTDAKISENSVENNEIQSIVESARATDSSNTVPISKTYRNWHPPQTPPPQQNYRPRSIVPRSIETRNTILAPTRTLPTRKFKNWQSVRSSATSTTADLAVSETMTTNEEEATETTETTIVFHVWHPIGEDSGLDARNLDDIAEMQEPSNSKRETHFVDVPASPRKNTFSSTNASKLERRTVFVDFRGALAADKVGALYEISTMFMVFGGVIVAIAFSVFWDLTSEPSRSGVLPVFRPFKIAELGLVGLYFQHTQLLVLALVSTGICTVPRVLQFIATGGSEGDSDQLFGLTSSLTIVTLYIVSAVVLSDRVSTIIATHIPVAVPLLQTLHACASFVASGAAGPVTYQLASGLTCIYGADGAFRAGREGEQCWSAAHIATAGTAGAVLVAAAPWFVSTASAWRRHSADQTGRVPSWYESAITAVQILAGVAHLQAVGAAVAAHIVCACLVIGVIVSMDKRADLSACKALRAMGASVAVAVGMAIVIARFGTGPWTDNGPVWLLGCAAWIGVGNAILENAKDASAKGDGISPPVELKPKGTAQPNE